MTRIKLLSSIFFLSLFLNISANVQVYELNLACETGSFFVENAPTIQCQIELDFMNEIRSFTMYTNSVTVIDGIIEGPQANIGIYLGQGLDAGFQFIGVQNLMIGSTPRVYSEGEVIQLGGIYDASFGRVMWRVYEQFAEWPSPPIFEDALEAGYLGFYVTMNGNRHYGWISYGYEQNGNGMDLVIQTIAIEDEPNTPIIAGSETLQTGDFNLQGVSFVDADLNGAYDSGEALLGNVELDIISGNSTYNNFQVSNPFDISLSAGTFSISPNYNTDLWSLTTTDSYTVDLDALNPTAAGIDFGYSPVGTVEAVSASVNAQLARCSEVRTHTINLNNEGNTLVNGTMVYTFDDLCSFVDCSPLPDSVSGNNIYFSFTDLNYNESRAFQVNLLMPDAGSVGEYMDFFLTVRNEGGWEIANDYVQALVSCSYDPNDITEYNGWTENGFFLAGDRLEYLIRFQNTGNDTAYNVSLVDQLPAGFEYESLHAIAWSHPCQSYITPDGQLIVQFENIFLPDSGANELASHGFFRFSIAAEATLSAGDILENGVEIYFDSNPAVITNTAVNTVFECEGLAGFSVAEEVCLGNELNTTSNQEWVSQYLWLLNGNAISSENSISLTPENPGAYELKLTVSNPLCIEEETRMVDVLEPEWVEVVQNDEMLYANTFSPGPFTWYFNGSIIPGAEEASYMPELSGSYHVTVVGFNGCAAVSNELEFIISGLADLEDADLLISPNPVVDVLNLQWKHWNNKAYHVQLFDQTGRLVSNQQFRSSACTLSREGLSAGSYELRILSIDGSEILMHRKVVLD